MASSQPSSQQAPSNAPNPTVIHLQRPEKLSNVLKDDYDDCTSCRLMGSATMFGIAAYIFVSGRRSLLARGPEIIKRSGKPGTLGIRLMGLGTLSGSFVAMGLYRLIN